MKKNCRLLAADYGEGKDSKNKRGYSEANKSSAKSLSGSDSDALVSQQALQASAVGNWIMDSKVTCCMCSDKKLFSKLTHIQEETSVTLGDGHKLKAVG